MNSTGGGRPRRILVVGDWVIDDYWLCGEHRSVTASRVGRRHLRALHPPTAKVRTLAAAARVTSLLYENCIKKPTETGDEIVGLGFWHPDDQILLQCAVANPDCFDNSTPARLSLPNRPDTPPGVSLINLADHTDKAKQASTRVLRVLLQEETALESLGRIDWETRPDSLDDEPDDKRSRDGGVKSDDEAKSESYYAWHVPHDQLLGAFINVQNRDLQRPIFDKTSATKKSARKSRDDLEPLRFSAVVIKDLRKGVVSYRLINWLIQNILGPLTENGAEEAVQWFISTKAHVPEWLSLLAEKDKEGEPHRHRVRLVVIPEIAAGDAIRKGVYSWFTPTTESGKPTAADGGGKPTAEALKEVAKLWEKIGGGVRSDLFVVTLPGQYRVLARAGSLGVFQPKPLPVPFCEHAPMASACFPFLVRRLLDQPKAELKAVIHQALNDTYRFNQQEEFWISTGERSEAYCRRTSKSWEPDPPTFPESDVIPFDWSKEERDWKNAMEQPCILDLSEKPRLELWRAMTEIPRYVCCVPNRRKRLAKLTQEVQEFAQQSHRSYNLCGLIVADPGAGKTTLVRELADAVGLPWLEFNITQLQRRDDLFACFDTIVMAQAQARRRPLLVFVDEINALLDGHHVYDAFLTPLSDNVYLRAGKKFFLRPCIWLFASTERLRRLEGAGNQRLRRQPKGDVKKADKEMDFTSRLTMDDIDLLSAGPKAADGKTWEEWQRIENIYRGVAMIRHQFPDVRAVSHGLLDYFYDLKSDYSPRRLRALVKRLRNVQYSRVSLSNLPDDPDLWMCSDAEKKKARADDRVFVSIA